MPQKERQPVLVVGNADFEGNLTIHGSKVTPDGSSLMGLTPSASIDFRLGVTGRSLRHTRITFTGLAVNIEALDDEVGVLLATIDDGTMLILGAETDLAFTKTSGLADTDDVSVALGSSEAANDLLTTPVTADAILDRQDHVVTSNTFDIDVHTNDNTSAVPPIYMPETEKSIYLNLGFPLFTAGGVLTIDGTIDLHWLDIGRY